MYSQRAIISAHNPTKEEGPDMSLASDALSPNLPARGYWRHSVTGEIWACETANGLPLRCAGPFGADTADEILLPYLDYGSREMTKIEAEWRFFAPYVRCRVCAKSINTGEAANVSQHDASHVAPGTAIHAACVRIQT